MATMNYSNPGWTNGSAPAITGGVGGTLTLLSDAVASVGSGGTDSVRDSDKLGGKAIGTSGNTVPLLDGTNSFSGVNTFANVTDATTKDTGSIVTEGGIGVEKAVFAAGKVTGSQLVSTIATGTAPFVVASTTTVANLDADTVSGYGIGVNTAPVLASFNVALGSGAYNFNSSTTGLPQAGGNGGVVVVCGTQGDIAIANDGATAYVWFGQRGHGTGAFNWAKLWCSATDGNGGEPPAPKPRNSSGNIGDWAFVTNTLPSTGVYSTMSFKSGILYSVNSDQGGGTNMNTALSTTGIDKVMYWRTA